MSSSAGRRITKAFGATGAGVAQRIHMAPKLTAGVDLLPDQGGLFRREEARTCLASHGGGESVESVARRLPLAP